MRRRVGILWILFLLPLSAVFGQALPPVVPSTVVGDILGGGSAAAAPLLNRLIERFRAEGYQGNLVVDSGGATAAFERLCRGEIDFVSADRQITPAEQNACTSAGRNPLAFRIASDAMVVAVSVQNTFLTDLTTDELRRVFSTALNWNEIRPVLPAQPINRYLPAPNTDDFTFLAAALFAGDGFALQTAIGVQTSSDFNVLLQNVQSDPNAIGFFPATFAARSAAVLRVISLNGVAPNTETISNNAYILARPLVLYADSARLGQQRQVAAFINYAITGSAAELTPLGLFPAGEQNLAAARAAWAQAAGGAATVPPPVSTPEVAVTEAAAPPDEPLTGVYCASGSALIRINGQDAPQPPEGCLCVQAYGLHTLETNPDLATATDESAIETLLNSPERCQAGVTTYLWSEGAYSSGSFSANRTTAPADDSAPVSAADQALILLVDARTDLETLAVAEVGVDRPAGWSGSLDVTDPALALLIRLDVELLADALLGAGVRPAGWFGSVASTPYALARDIRHDLELLADETGGAGRRPNGWAGTKGDTLLRCSRATQTLVNLLQRGGVFTLALEPDDPQFCLKAEIAAAQFAEANLLTSAADRPIFSAGTQAALPGATTIDTPFAVAFLDKGAALPVGVIPQGEPVTPVGRSLTQFSRMTLVQGAGFLVFVDYRDTTLSDEQFETLPDADNAADPFCSADWCGR